MAVTPNVQHRAWSVTRWPQFLGARQDGLRFKTSSAISVRKQDLNSVMLNVPEDVKLPNGTCLLRYHNIVRYEATSSHHGDYRVIYILA